MKFTVFIGGGVSSDGNGCCLKGETPGMGADGAGSWCSWEHLEWTETDSCIAARSDAPHSLPRVHADPALHHGCRAAAHAGGKPPPSP